MKNSIAAFDLGTQVQEVPRVIGRSFHRLLKSVAHENGEYVRNEFTVNLKSLDLFTKRLILSHILDSEEYEWICHSSIRTEQMFKENLTYLSAQMADVEDEVYTEIMEESGLYAKYHSDNGERYWSSK